MNLLYSGLRSTTNEKGMYLCAFCAETDSLILIPQLLISPSGKKKKSLNNKFSKNIILLKETFIF